MKSPFRFTRVAQIAATCALMLTGCGLELLGTVQRIQATGTSKKGNPWLEALPSWPVNLKVGLGEASRSLGDFIQPGQGELPLLEMEDGHYEVRLKPIAFDGFDLGAVLSAGTPTNDIAIDPVGIAEKTPDSFKTPSFTRSLDDLQILSLPVNVAPLGTLTIQQIIDLANTTDPTKTFERDLARGFTLPTDLTFPSAGSVPLDIGPVDLKTTSRIALGANSRLLIPVTRNIGGADSHLVAPVVNGLRIESNGKLINKEWLDLHPSVVLPLAGDLEVPLDEGAEIAGSLEIHGGIQGALLAGFHPVNLNSAQQIVLSEGTASVKIARFSLGGQASASFPLKSYTQDFSEKFNALESKGIQEVSQIRIGTGSIELRVSNGFGLSSRLGFTIRGLLDSDGQLFKRAVFIPGSLAHGTPRVATRSISLAGAILTSASISVSPEAETIATDDRANDIQLRYSADFDAIFPDTPARATAAAELEIPDGLAIFEPDAKLQGTITIGSMQIESLQGKLRPSQPTTLPQKSFPIDLPRDLVATANDPASLSVQPASISLTLRLENRSQLAGTVDLQASARVDGATRSVDLSRIPVPTLRPAEAVGLSGVTVIEVTESNSNLVDLIRMGARELSVGGEVRIDSGATPVTLTARDRISGSVLAAIPLSVNVQGSRTHDIQPPIPLNLDSVTRSQFEKGLVERLALMTQIENGLHIPLKMELRISAQTNPYQDGAALIKLLDFGDGASTASTLELTQEELPVLMAARTIGVRIRAGDGAPRSLTLRSSDALRIRLMLAMKLRVKPSVLTGLR